MVKSGNKNNLKKGGFTSEDQHSMNRVNTLTVKAPTFSPMNLFPKHVVSEEHHSKIPHQEHPSLHHRVLHEESGLKNMILTKLHGSGRRMTKDKKDKIIKKKLPRKLKGGNMFFSNYASALDEEKFVSPNNDWNPQIAERAAPVGNNMNSDSGEWGSARHENSISTPGSDWAFSLGENAAIATQMGAGKKKIRGRPRKIKGGNSPLDDIAKVSGNIIKDAKNWAISVGENVYPALEEDFHFTKQVGSAKDKKKMVKPKKDMKKDVKPKKDMKKDDKKKKDKK